MPFGDVLVRGGEPLGRGGVVTERRIDRLERDLRVADHRQGTLLVGVPRGGVHADEPDVRIAEDRPRAGREVLEPCPDRDDDIGALGDGVRRARTGDADRPGVVRVVVGKGRLAGDGLDDRDAVALGEGPDGVRRAGVVDAAPGDEHRPHRVGDHVRRPTDVARVRARATDVVLPRLEEPDRVVVRLRLDVLREREERGTARGRVEHRRERLW